jgi:ATP-dependent DNA helicase RecQ
LLADIVARFEKRERNEVARIDQVLSLVTGAGCITNALARHFGEEREGACGHCSYCETGESITLPPARTTDAIPTDFPVGQWKALRAKHPDALGEPRQAARFLCGLTSPALTRARLVRHELFGSLEEIRFQTILNFCSTE